jgi:transcription antitermination factor NusG
MSGLTERTANNDEIGLSTMGYNSEVRDLDARWYAVWTRSRQEKASASMLAGLGIEHYLPLKSELCQWTDRKQLVESPLFGGYLFICTSLSHTSKLRVLKVPGIVAFVGNQSGPLPIPDQQIEDIRTVLTARVECSVHASLHEGDRVRVVRGALAGVEGTLLRTNSTPRLLVSVELIRQSLCINVLREDVEVISLSSAPPAHPSQYPTVTCNANPQL